jgi:hypothetical protein
MEMNPSSEFAQLMPRFAYIGVVANGRATAKRAREVLAAEAADADQCGYASVR